jgi:hypothetical protein
MDTAGKAKQDRDRGYAAPVVSKEQWLRTYTPRILKVWLGQRAPLGLAPAYATWIRKDLSEFYAQPLMRAFIERTY